MTNVKADISMSLDGYITGPDDRVGQPLGAGGERLHQWIFDLASWREMHSHDPRTGQAFTSPVDATNADDAVMAESWQNIGAVVMGRRMFDLGEEPWGDNPPFHMPVYVVTHHARPAISKAGGTTFIFVTEGVESAVAQAQVAANGKDVSVAGGGQLIQQCLSAGALDEIQIHLVPVLLGDSRSLFGRPGSGRLELEATRVFASPTVTHLRFRVAK